MFSDDLENNAKKALTKPQDFMHWGNDEMFKTWGYAGINQTRDSQNYELSNFAVITKDLIERFPEDFAIEGYRHWACGHVDQLTVRILKNEGDITEDNITDAFKAAMEYQDKLADYPIIDDDHYYLLCHDDLIEYIKTEKFFQEYVDTDIEDWEEKMANGLYEQLGSIDMSDPWTHVKDDDVYRAIYYEKIYSQDRDHYDFWKEFTDRLKLEPIKYDFIKSETDQTLFEIE